MALLPDAGPPTYDAPPRPCRYQEYDYCRRPAEPGYKSCRPCRTKRSALQYRQRRRRIAAGRCAYNGCPRPPGPAHLCPERYHAAKERNRQRRERFRAAGLCFQCGRRTAERRWQQLKLPAEEARLIIIYPDRFRDFWTGTHGKRASI